MHRQSPRRRKVSYAFGQRVIAVTNPPGSAALGRAAPGIAAGPAMASPDDRTNTRCQRMANHAVGLYALRAPYGVGGHRALVRVPEYRGRENVEVRSSRQIPVRLHRSV